MAAAAEEAELLLHKEPGPRGPGGGGRGGPRNLRLDLNLDEIILASRC